MRAARAMSESLPGWLLALARILLAALEQYVALEGPLPPPPPAAIADQDTVAAALRAVGEGGRLASLRRMTLLQLHATADALESRYPTQAPATIADAAWLGRTLMLNRGRGGERPVPLLGPARMSVGRAWDVATSGLYATLRDGEADSSGSPAFNAEVAQAAADWQGEVEGAGAGSLASAAARDRAVAEAVLAVLQWWRPLVVAAPPPPQWSQRAQAAAAAGGGGGDEASAVLEAAASHLQAQYRARAARSRVRVELQTKAAAADAAGKSDECKVLTTRSALASTRDALRAAMLLGAALQPEREAARLQAMQRHTSLRIATLGLAPSRPAAAAAAAAVPSGTPPTLVRAAAVGRPADVSTRRARAASHPRPSPCRRRPPASTSSLSSLWSDGWRGRRRRARQRLAECNGRGEPRASPILSDDFDVLNVGGRRAGLPPPHPSPLTPTPLHHPSPLPPNRAAIADRRAPPPKPSPLALASVADDTAAALTAAGSSLAAVADTAASLARALDGTPPGSPFGWVGRGGDVGGFGDTPAPTGAVSPRRAEAAADAAADFGGGTSARMRRTPSPSMCSRAAAQAEVGVLSSVDLQLLRARTDGRAGRLSQKGLARLLERHATAEVGLLAATETAVGAALRAMLEAARSRSAQVEEQAEVGGEADAGAEAARRARLRK